CPFAMAPERLLDPLETTPLLQWRPKALHPLWGRFVGGERAFLRQDEGIEEGGRGQVGDGERVADQIVALAELGLEAIQGGEDLLPRRLGGFFAADAEAQAGEGARVGDGAGAVATERSGNRAPDDGFEALAVVAQLVEGEQAEIWAELLVEEVLQLEGAAQLRGIGGIEGRLREALLERGDDRGRVGDRLPVELEHREGEVGGVA